MSLRAPGDAIPGLNANEEPLCLRCTGIPLDVTANGSDLYQAGSGDTKPGSRFIAQLRSGTRQWWGRTGQGWPFLIRYTAEAHKTRTPKLSIGMTGSAEVYRICS